MASGARIRITKLMSENDIGAQIEPAMLKLGNALASRMQRLVPKRTWRLHDSIQPPEVEVNGGKVVTTIAVGGRVVDGKYVGYHLLVEQGTSKMKAQAFMRPALYQSRSADLTYTGPGVTKHGAGGGKK